MNAWCRNGIKETTQIKTMNQQRTIHTVHDYLCRITSMLRSAVSAATNKRLGKYACFEEFILKHGRSFDNIVELPGEVKRGKSRECFKNAATLAIEYYPTWIYCEGYAAGPIPVLHAWCVNRRGAVIDPTWNDGTEYFGIPIKQSYLLKSLRENEVYGLLGVSSKCPIMKARPSEFKEKL